MRGLEIEKSDDGDDSRRTEKSWYGDESDHESEKSDSLPEKPKNHPPIPPKGEATVSDLRDKKEEEGTPGEKNTSDHPLPSEVVINPNETPESQPVVIGPERPPTIVPDAVENIHPVGPPPAFTIITTKGKGKHAASPSLIGKGKNTVFIPDPMALLQQTIGQPPASESELFARQIAAQKLGGFHPTMYNWLVFGKAPGPVISSPIILVPNSTVESVSGAAPSHALSDLDPNTTE